VADFIGEANLLPGIYAASNDGDAALTPDLGALPGERADNFDPAPGSQVLFSIRPEHVHTGDEAVAQPYHLTGTVTGVSYLGAASLLTVSAGGTSLRANVPGVFTGEIGQRIEFGWSPSHGRILPHDDRFAAVASA
jgi:ABC-type Fe3+/spermidine/putrescine transport system ATPase subunit